MILVFFKKEAFCTKKKNIELITNLMNSLSISFSKAVELLKVSEDEVLEIKKYFEA